MDISHCHIPTQVGYRPAKVINERPPFTRKTIRKDNKQVQALTLPKMTNYNVRSLFPKIGNFALDMKERESDISFLTEVWEKKEKKKHQLRLEELLEINGIKYISTPRPGAQRGGGAAIAVRLEKFTISKLNIPLPRSVEVVWGLLKPKVVTGKIHTIIVCCFYSPPRSRKNHVLIDHLTVTLQSLLNIHTDGGVIICGDRNSIEISALLSIDPSLRQTVRHGTRGPKILDIICTNLARYFNEPIIIPAIQPDRVGHGVPSDHSGVVATPNTNQGQVATRTKVNKKIRPLPESLIQTFEIKLASQNFDFMNDLPVNEMVKGFQNVTDSLLFETFPEKEIVISPEDKPWFNEELRKLKRRRQREYNSRGRSEKYLELVAIFDEKSKNEISKYKDKVMLEVTEGRRGSSYPAIKRLGMRPGETSHAQFQLPGHVEMNCSSAQSAEIIAEHFSHISQEYEPLNLNNLTPNVKIYLSNADQSLAPTLTPVEVQNRIMKANKPNGLVPGDLPKKLVQNCSATLAPPVSTIYNKISKSALFPSQWKIEHQIALPKVSPPESEDDLRNIAKTPFLSKVYESFVGGWLLPIIKPFLDPGQCGLKGLSITHYLIKLLHFVHKTLDLRKPHAVVAACVDLSKAFNRVDHALIIHDLYDMHTPAWLLRIIFSYLSDRSMFITFNGAQSSQKMLPGGGPQGAYLGGIIFIIKYNGAFLRPPIPRGVQGPVLRAKSEKVKFVDDGTVAVSVDLKACLVPDPVQRARPLNYHERTGHILPAENNMLQYYISDTEEYVSENKMIINKHKTKVISFTKSRKWDFPPELQFSDGAQLECVPETKLLGVIVSQDLKWNKNTDYICQKARQKLWILRRMLNFDLTVYQLFDVYIKEVRSILELAVPVWHSGLTKQHTADIEGIQKVAFKIILQSRYVNYQQACTTLSAQTLEERRTKLCRKFAMKNIKSEKPLFTLIKTHPNTRQVTNLVREFKCNFGRFKKSSLPFLANLINSRQTRG